MGRKRVFTEEVYEELKKGIATNSFFDFFNDIPLYINNAFGEVGLADDLSNIENYLRDVSDLNNYTEKKLDEIFNNVKDVDAQYAKIFSAKSEMLKDYGTVLQKLTEAIGNKSFNTDFNREGFLASICEESNTMLQLKWQEILSRPQDTITDEEYTQLASLLIRTGDIHILEQMLNMCYEYSEVSTFSEGGYQTTVRVVYEVGEKLKKLAQAMNSVMKVLLAYDKEAESVMVSRAIRYNQLFKVLLAHDDKLEIVSKMGQDGKTIETLNEKLIQISTNDEGELVIGYYPYLTGVGFEHYAVQEKRFLVISGVSSGSGAWQAVLEEAMNYINAYSGVDQNVMDAVSQETVNQIIGACYGEVPGVSILSALISIADTGVKAEDTTIVKAEEIANIGNVLNQFEVLYVSSTVDDDMYQREFSIYPNITTQLKIDAFNEYMQKGSGKIYAADIGYNELPGEKLTFGYITEHPGKVANMLSLLAKEQKEAEDILGGVELEKIEERMKSEKNVK